MPVTEAPIKTDGRRKYAVAGNGFNQAEIDLLTYLAKGYDIPEAARQRLLAMTPASYTGKATELARRI